MPLKQCTSDGKSGFKWGDSGHCYTGPGAKEKALKQGRAIEVNKSKSTSLIEKVRGVLEKSLSKRFEYEDPKTGEVFLFNRRGGHKKNGRLLVFRGEAADSS